ncbi:hypothetical protein [Pseudoxanthomonas wuyuanensis]|uniref:Secreted protein n=1 Tax=Pseudoxanthomonas wuyuanensis TaxID=1073196 RepID=A0A286D6Q2_9GAMM|nr:hypothetical protein [Pseudoxanthomonas wuyuanensis]KAF1718756.1 hypothetical protein CSC75_18210 [Pseudoxanthomonas wuyuanensis]SOD54320.1 hypothetical protein SAMN06296416_103243 [Pseudoxanthomonas wuyuanensis]
MLRALPILLLLWTCVAAAQNGRTPVPDNSTSCQELVEKSTEAGLQQSDRPRTAAVRNKYAQPAPPANTAAPVRGGGDDDDAPMTRPRAPKWHSFLPGMFR